MKYDYVCRNQDCLNFNKVFEVNQSIKDDKLKNCNYCKKDTLERLITKNNGFSINGIGVYQKGTY